MPYVILDERYEKVRHAGSLRDCAGLIAIGILPAGRRCVLGVSVSLSEADRVLQFVHHCPCVL
ncbi:MAG: transposase [Planctomycetales bacterium]|nr:transposase [Planctomycetales bacterium]